MEPNNLANHTFYSGKVLFTPYILGQYMKQNMIVFTSSSNYRTTAGIASKTKDIKLLEETPRREYTHLALK